MQGDVPKGPATITGYGASLAGFVGLVLALVFPSEDQQTLAVIAAGICALVPLIVTNVGRMWQAKYATQAAAQVESARIYESTALQAVEPAPKPRKKAKAKKART
jgi:type IV secretory pathway VirB3-like protein